MARVGIATRLMIQERITNLRGCNEMISSEGQDPAHYQDIIRQAKTAENATADRAYCAASVLERLDDVERELGEFERELAQVKREVDESERSLIASLRQSAYNAIYYALALASDVHALTVVDNEGGISQQIALAESRETARAKTSRAAEHKEWNKAANWKPGLSKLAVARGVKKSSTSPKMRRRSPRG